MNATELKYKLQNSLNVFSISMIIAAVALFIILVTNTNYWLLGFIPTIIIFSIIGSVFVIKCMLVLTSTSIRISNFSNNEFEEKFVGYVGMNNIFYIMVPFIYCTVYVIMYTIGINIISIINIMDVCVIIPILIATNYLLYVIINQLSFALFFVSAIFSWIEDYVPISINDQLINEGYNTANNLNKMKKKYKKRIEWYKSHLGESNRVEYESKIKALNTAIEDIEAITNKIEI